jgi:hypothetical protein
MAESGQPLVVGLSQRSARWFARVFHSFRLVPESLQNRPTCRLSRSTHATIDNTSAYDRLFCICRVAT